MKILAARALELATRASARRCGLVLVYHAVAEEAGDWSEELVPAHSKSVFEAQMRYVRSRYQLVSAGEIVEAVRTRRRGQPFPVAVTFDDDLRSHRTHALPVLEMLGIPATFFLTGASLERPFAFWWQRLQAATDRGLTVSVPGGGIHEKAAQIESMPPAQRDLASEQLPALDATSVALDRDDVGVLVAGGFELGFHTLRHDRLPDLEDTLLERALHDGRAELEAAAHCRLRSIAYPHGRADERVAAAARAAGFSRGFTGRYEAVTPTSDPLLLGRLEPTYGSASDFSLQLVRAILRSSHR